MMLNSCIHMATVGVQELNSAKVTTRASFDSIPDARCATPFFSMNLRHRMCQIFTSGRKYDRRLYKEFQLDDNEPMCDEDGVITGTCHPGMPAARPPRG